MACVYVYTFISSVCVLVCARDECKSRMRSRVTRELYICYVVVVCRAVGVIIGAIMHILIWCGYFFLRVCVVVAVIRTAVKWSGI